ncbi:MAG: Tfp pilus assembly protein PilF [Planctomycetota bacterium]|jgi:Tfp pilus assembly protein PilF
MRVSFYAGPLALIVILAGCASQSVPETTLTSKSSPELLAQVALVDARRLIIEGDPRDAMTELDTALELKNENAEVQFLRGEATLRMGAEDGNPFFFEDSRLAFLEAAESGEAPSAWFGAARATWMLFFATGDATQLEEAIDFATKGVELRLENARYERYFRNTPERTLSELYFSAYTSAKNGAIAEDKAPEYFESARDAIEAEIALDPTVNWGWVQLSNLYLWEERREDARTTITTAIKLNPQDTVLHETQQRLAQEDSGWSEVESIYTEFAAEHEESAIGHWWLGRAKYEVALESMLANQDDQSETFKAAEAELLRARELDETYTDACQAYEVICRDGVGWSLFYAGDLEAAEEAYWSMEELFEGGLRWEVQDRLWSGTRSLSFLLMEHNTAWEEGLGGGTQESYSEGFARLIKATELADRLLTFDFEDRNNANNAGYFNRDIGVQYETQGTHALQAEEPDMEKVSELFELAKGHMEASYKAYVQAAILAPQDARTINDTGLILAYYLQRDIETARDYLERAISVGLPQLEAGIEDEDERTMTREAVGDAYQNLGVISLTLEGDAATAQRLFEKSLEYERNPRLGVTQFFLPLCSHIASGKVPAARAIESHYWKNLDSEQVLKRVAILRELQEQLTSQ